MRKLTTLSILLLLLAGMIFASGAQENADAKEVQEAISHDELVALAQQEGELFIYSSHSRAKLVAASFSEKYGIKAEVSQLGGVELLEKATKEANANLDAADVIFCQDGSRVYQELVLTGLVIPFVPEDVKGNMIDDSFEDPLVFEAMNSLLIYNNENTTEQPVTNVWQLAEPEFKGLFQFKDPFAEAVNMNFFTMLTREDWAEKLAVAYKNYYGKDIVLTTPNAGYEWIKAVYNNGAILGKSDTTISENVGAKGQSRQLIGLFTYNKLRTADAKGLALAPSYNVEPFSGFVYPSYVLIPANARNVNAAKLFIEYSLTEEGWEVYDTLGDYSAVKALADNQEDALDLSDWLNQTVFEDYQWCAEARADVEEFITNIL